MNTEQLQQEFTYRTSRSGGKGGQHVNKVETKVEARLHVDSSQALSAEEKLFLRENLGERISAEGYLAVTNQTKRSQLANKQLAEHKLLRLIQQALIRPKKRKRAKVPKAVKEARLQAKKRQSEKKAARRIIYRGQ